MNTEVIRTGNCDNLQPWRIYELAEAFATTSGKLIPAGSEFWFEYAIVTLKTRDALVHGSTPEGEPLVFQTRDNGHRSLFVNTWREWRPRGGGNAAEVPAAVAARVNTPEAQWLAARPQFAQVSEILAGKYASPGRESARRDAEVLYQAARKLENEHLWIATWLADWSQTFYHAWMSQATSGGEAAEMRDEIRGELIQLNRLVEAGERQRAGWRHDK